MVGAAQRRRERRLRSWYRHEQQTVRMALATYTHHSAQRQKKAMAREEDGELDNALGRRLLPAGRQARCTSVWTTTGVCFAALSTPLVEVRPQPGVLRHTAAHIVDIVPYVQILDVPVPQLGDQVVDLLRRPGRAEQLVEVPTIASFSSLQQRTSKQTIDIPVHHGRGNRGGGEGEGGLQGLRPGQKSTALGGAVHVDIPVPHGRGLVRQAFKVSPRDRVQQRLVEQISLTFQFRVVEVFTDQLLLPGAVDEASTGGFRTLPRSQKSARLGPHSGSELGADFDPWTPAAYADSVVLEEDELETESESGSQVEEDAGTRCGAGFRLLRVCMRFLERTRLVLT